MSVAVLPKTCSDCGIYGGMWSPCLSVFIPHFPTDKACEKFVPKNTMLVFDEKLLPY